MRFTARPFECTKLCDLRGACEPFGVVIQVPGGGPPPSFYIGIAPTTAELQGNTDDFNSVRNQHKPSVGLILGDVGGTGNTGSKFETYVFAPLFDVLYAVCDPAEDDQYLDVLIYRMGRACPGNSSGLSIPGGD